MDGQDFSLNVEAVETVDYMEVATLQAFLASALQAVNRLLQEQADPVLGPRLEAARKRLEREFGDLISGPALWPGIDAALAKRLRGPRQRGPWRLEASEPHLTFPTVMQLRFGQLMIGWLEPSNESDGLSVVVIATVFST